MALAPLVLDDLDWAQLDRRRAACGCPRSRAGSGRCMRRSIPASRWWSCSRGCWTSGSTGWTSVPEPLFRARGLRSWAKGCCRCAARATVLALRAGEPRAEVAAGTAARDRARGGRPGLRDRRRRRAARRPPRRARGRAASGARAPVDRTHDLDERRGVTLFAADGGPGEARIVLYLPGAARSPRRGRCRSSSTSRPRPRCASEWDPDAVPVAAAGGGHVVVLARRAAVRARSPPRPCATARAGCGGRARAPAHPGRLGAGRPGRGRAACRSRSSSARARRPSRSRRRCGASFPTRGLPRTAALVRETQPRRPAGCRCPAWPSRSTRTARRPSPRRCGSASASVDGRWHRWRPVHRLRAVGPRRPRVPRGPRARGASSSATGSPAASPGPIRTVDPNVRIARAWSAAGAGRQRGRGPLLERASRRTCARRRDAAAVGGREPETIDEARVRIGGLLDRVERAVTADGPRDARRVATPGVDIARAHAAVGFHPGHPVRASCAGAVTVFVGPVGAARRGRRRERRAWPRPCRTRARWPPCARTSSRRAWSGPRSGSARPATGPSGSRCACSGDPVDPARRRGCASRTRCVASSTRWRAATTATGWPFGEPLRPSVLMREAGRRGRGRRDRGRRHRPRRRRAVRGLPRGRASARTTCRRWRTSRSRSSPTCARAPEACDDAPGGDARRWGPLPDGATGARAAVGGGATAAAAGRPRRRRARGLRTASAAFTPEWTESPRDGRGRRAGARVRRADGAGAPRVPNRLPEKALVEFLRDAGVDALPGARRRRRCSRSRVSSGARESVLVPGRLPGRRAAGRRARATS